MDQKTKRLFEKFIQNQCTKSEIDTIVAYLKRNTDSNSDVLPSVREVQKLMEGKIDLPQSEMDKIYNKIVKKIGRKEKKIFKRPLLWRYTAACAIILFILLGGLYSKKNGTVINTRSTSIVNIKDSITLQVGKGKVKVLAQRGIATILDENGVIIGQQKNSKLVYNTHFKEKEKATTEIAYNTLTVPYGKTFEIRLSDGTTVHMNAGSSLKYPTKFANIGDRTVFLSGEAFFHVSKDVAHPFIVHANDLKIRVLGTKFNVSAYPEDKLTDVVLVEGSVDLRINKTSQQEPVILSPGYKGSFNKKSKTLTTESVVTDLYTSWINGRLIFRNMTFENILKKLERRYNVTITNNNEQLANEKFNANFGDEPIKKVMAYLKTIYSIDFYFHGNNIIIN